MKKAKDENGHMVRTDKIIGFLLTRKGAERFLLLRNSSTQCIALDANCRVIMESYVDFPGVKKLSKKGFNELGVNPRKLGKLWRLERE